MEANGLMQKRVYLESFLKWLQEQDAKHLEMLQNSTSEVLLECLASSTLILAKLYQKEVTEHEILLPLVIQGILLGIGALIKYGYNSKMVEEMLHFMSESFDKYHQLEVFIKKNLLTLEHENQYKQHIKSLKQSYWLQLYWLRNSLSTYKSFDNIIIWSDASLTEQSLTRIEDEYIYSLTLEALTNKTLKLNDAKLIKSSQRIALSTWYRQVIIENIGNLPDNELWNHLNNFLGLITSDLPNNEPDWKQYRQELFNLRNSLAGQINISESPLPALIEFNQKLNDFTLQLFKDAEIVVGKASFKFCLVALGSLSQDMLCAYSDIELALIVEDENLSYWNEPYAELSSQAYHLKQLMQLFEFKVICLGEKGHGFQLDDNSQPRTEPSLCGTPDQLVKFCLNQENESHDGLVYSLLHAKHFYGDEKLFKVFRQNLLESISQFCIKSDNSYLALTKTPLTWHQYWALAQVERNKREYNKYFIGKKEMPDLKKPYLKLLRFIVLDLALYLNLTAQNFIQACEQLEKGDYLPANFIKKIKDHVDYLLIERNRVHLKRGREDDSVLPDHQERLQEINNTILSPYFKTIHILKERGFALWQQAFWLSLIPYQLCVTQETSCSLTLLEFGFENQSYFLLNNFIDKIFDSTGQIKSTITTGNGAIFKYDLFSLKIFLSDMSKLESAEEVFQSFVMRESLINQLTRMFGWNVIPKGCAIKLKLEINGRKPCIFYGWLTQYIEGIDLSSMQQHQPEFLKSIEQKDYTALFLLNLLNYPDIGQLSDYIMLNSADNNGGKRKIYSVNHHNFFIEPINMIDATKTREKSNFTGGFYALSNFYEELSRDIYTACKQLDFYKLRETLYDYMKAYEKLIRNTLAENFTHNQLQNFKFHNTLLLPHAASFALWKLEGLVLSFLIDIESFNAANILIKYKEIEVNQLPQQIKEHLKEQLKVIYKKLSLFIDWRFLSLTHQKQLLNVLQQQTLEYLNLTHCLIVNDENLVAISQKSPNLTFLDISSCPNLIENTTKNLKNLFAKINILIINDNAWLTKINVKSRLNNLSVLSIKKCEKFSYKSLSKDAIKKFEEDAKRYYCEGNYIAAVDNFTAAAICKFDEKKQQMKYILEKLGYCDPSHRQDNTGAKYLYIRSALKFIDEHIEQHTLQPDFYYHLAKHGKDLVPNVDSDYFTNKILEKTLAGFQQKLQQDWYNPIAHYYLGRIYEKGYGVKSNLKLAADSYRQAYYVRGSFFYRKKASKRLMQLQKINHEIEFKPLIKDIYSLPYSLDKFINTKHDCCGKLINWIEDGITKYGVGVSNDHVVGMWPNFKIISMPTNRNIVSDITYYSPDKDEIIKRLNCALYTFSDWKFNLGWNDEHFARLVVTNNPESYKVEANGIFDSNIKLRPEAKKKFEAINIIWSIYKIKEYDLVFYNWHNNGQLKYGISISNQSILTFEQDGYKLLVAMPEFKDPVKNIIVLPDEYFNKTDKMLKRIKYALLCFQEKMYNDYSWNDEHFARLIVTGEAKSYKSGESVNTEAKKLFEDALKDQKYEKLLTDIKLYVDSRFIDEFGNIESLKFNL